MFCKYVYIYISKEINSEVCNQVLLKRNELREPQGSKEKRMKTISESIYYNNSSKPFPKTYVLKEVNSDDPRGPNIEKSLRHF